MKPGKVLWITASGISLLLLAATAFLYDRVGAQVPIHWNASGEVDNWAPKYVLWLTACLPVILLGILTVIPRIDPRTDNYKLHAKAYSLIMLGLVLLFSGVHLLTLLVGAGIELNTSKIIPVALGLLFICIGNVMPQTRHNYTLGFKTPWTLASENVWKKTHQTGGYAMILCGVLMLVSVFLPSPIRATLLLTAIIGLVFFTTLYSYLVFRKEQKNKEDASV